MNVTRIGRSVIVAVAGVAVLALSGTASAVTVNKCAAGKKKCAVTKLKALITCHVKAERKGVVVEQACLDKAKAKFDGGAEPAKGCFAKLEAKEKQNKPETVCQTKGDTAAIEDKIDAFVDDVVTELDPGFPVPVKNKCSAGKKKCASAKLAALLGCHVKAEHKGVIDPACIQKAKDKFDGTKEGVPNPAKSCFAKLEAKEKQNKPETVCQTKGDTAAIGAKIDAFVDDLVCELDPTSDTCVGPPATPTVVSFEIGTSTALSGFEFHVGYPAAKGSFRGSNELVQCVTDTALGVFISNHQADQDNLITLIATAGRLGLPTTIACTFDVAANQVLSVDDLTIIVDEVTAADGGVGDPNDLVVTTSLADSTEACLGGTAIIDVQVDSQYTDLALTVGYSPSLVTIPGTGAVDGRVGIGPLGGLSVAEDIDTGSDGIDDAVHITFAGSETNYQGLFAEVHFDCMTPLSAADLASFTCTVDAASNGGAGEIVAGCNVSRIGFQSTLP